MPNRVIVLRDENGKVIGKHPISDEGAWSISFSHLEPMIINGQRVEPQAPRDNGAWQVPTDEAEKHDE